MSSVLDGVLDRPRTIITILLFLLGVGTYAYLTIPKEANPDIDVPVFYVSITQQGVSARDAERLLVKPMERELRGLEGLKEMRAIASEGHAGIILEFDADFDKDEALLDVRDKVDRAKADLPEDAEEPTITETNFSLVPTIIVALSGDVPEQTLYRHAKLLEDAIEAIPSVLSAELVGARDEMLEVLIDKTLLESYELNPIELLNTLSQNNSLVPAGFIDTGAGRFSVKVPGLIEDANDVMNLVIKQSDEGVVTISDIATIRRAFKDQTTFTRVNGAPAITVNVVKRLGENIIENNQAVRTVVAEVTKEWPEPIRIDFMVDESSFIYEVLGSLEASISTAIVLVMIVVVAALGLRSAILVGIAIPTSILLGFVTLQGLGMTVNMMVMFGLVLTVGLLVDGAIVVVEYADRKVADGMSRPDAFKRAAKLMFWPLVSSTATTLIAFLPMLLWPGVPGEFMSYLPIMVMVVLSVALVTALVFLPVLGGILSNALLLGLTSGAITAGVAVVLLKDAGPLAFVAAGLGFILATTITTKLANRWGAARAVPAEVVEPGPFRLENVKGVTGLYVRLLKLLAGNVFGIIFTIVFVVGTAFGVMTLFSTHNSGVEFFVDEEPNVAIVLVSARGNMSAKEALALVTQVEQRILGIDGVENIVSTAFPSGGGSDSGGGGTNDSGDRPADMIGQLQIELVDYCCRRQASEIFDDIRAVTDFAGIKTEVRKVQGGPPTGKDIQLQITANSYDEVLAATERVRDHLDTVEGLRDREDDRPLPGIEWQLTVDREEAGRFGANIQVLGQLIQLVTNGVLIEDYQPEDSDDQIDIRARFPEDERTLAQFADLRLQTEMGLVPIVNFIDITPKQRVSAITRIDGMYAMTVKADVIESEGVDLNTKIAEIDAWVKSQSWPDDLFFTFRGADEEQQESFAFLMKAMVASLVMMFVVLVTQFNSFYQTALTLSTIVLSVFGVLLGMVITGQKFSVIMTGTGIIALAGIVVNNAIVLIDTYNRLREDNEDVLSTVLATAAQRVRPILLTTITTIAGLIPMATQVNLDFFTRTVAVGGITSIWWVQLSTAVISGLAFSTILTLVVVPVMLALPETVSRTALRLRGRPQPALAPAPAEALPATPVAAAIAAAPEAEPTAAELAPVPAPVVSLPAAPAAEIGTAPALPPAVANDPAPEAPEPVPAEPTRPEADDIYAPVLMRPRTTRTDPASDAAPEPAAREPDGTAPTPDVYAPVLARHHRRPASPTPPDDGPQDGTPTVPHAAE